MKELLLLFSVLILLQRFPHFNVIVNKKRAQSISQKELIQVKLFQNIYVEDCWGLNKLVSIHV